MQPVSNDLHHCSPPVVLVVKDPEVTGQTEGQRGKGQGASQSQEIVEDGNARSEEEPNDAD